MAAKDKVSINIVSHNINGFNGSKAFLETKCDDNVNSIICVQEHWLRPAFKNVKSINQLRTVHTNFDGYGVSGMKDVHHASVMTGRPYGGTGFIFNKDFSPFLQPVLKYEGERISVMKLIDVDFTILIINVYFPYKQNTDEHRVQYLELLGAVENIITSNPLAKFIITGDFNYNIYDESQPMTPIIRDFLSNNDLICTHDLDSTFSADTSFTRCCIKGGTYSLLDFIFISCSLRDRVKRCYIDYDGSNPSDHFPLTMQIDIVPLVTGDSSHTGSQKGKYRVPWSKIQREDLTKYKNAMEEMLDGIPVPSDILHGDTLCSCEYHVSIINNYYHSLLSILEVADSLLPRKSPNGNRGKDFWTENLTRLKRDSVEAYK